MLELWFVPTLFFTGFGLVLIGNFLAFIYRKSDVKPNYFWNGRPEEPAPPVFFRMTYAKTLIRPDKYPLVYGVTFIGVAIMFVLVVLIIGSAIFRYS